jgi:lysozyme family protein
MSDDQCYDLYRVQYWDAVKADTLPLGVDLIVYDEAVNSGPVRSIMNLQSALGVSIDGHFGVETAAAVAAADDIHALIVKFDLNRMSFLQRLSNFQMFGVGWTSRVNDVTAKALRMAGV